MTTGVALERRDPGNARSAGTSTAMAIDPTPACANVEAPRPSVSSAACAPLLPGDQSNTIAGLPLKATSVRVVPPTSGSEKSGAGNGSYIHVDLGADGAGALDGTGVVPGRGCNGSVS